MGCIFMGNCGFINELNRLRKSSSDSIDNVQKFDAFKQYMHVARSVEEDLKELLRNVNRSGKKTLVLLCGSAGDGKSHLLSYLKNTDGEHLVDDERYSIYNDATESSSPTKTAIETLSEFLSSYKDANIDKPGKNVILAINLGVLNNFIESEYAEDFRVLKKYVEDSNILTNQVQNSDYHVNSHFQHVSFSDYHMYTLAPDGVHAGYIEDILGKIFSTKEENWFYQSYLKSCSLCPLSKKCPVKKNYEYMIKVERQRFVAKLLVEATIKDKVILTTREILNFIYDILVSRNFSYSKFQKLLIDDSAYLKEFLKQITPTLLFNSGDVTMLMNVLKRYDPLLVRTEKADEEAITYYVSSDISSEIIGVFHNTSFGDIICDSNMITKVNNDKVLKSSLYSLIVRVNSIEDGGIQEEIYSKYLKDLYWYNSGNDKKLGALYGMVENAVTQWCGSDEEGNLCLDKKHRTLYLYEKVEFLASIAHIPHPVEKDNLQRFIPTAVVAFEGGNSDMIALDIDYTLYELLYKLNRGYVQTADDRNNHADFISFINRILQTGSLIKEISVYTEKGKKAIVSKDRFGYKFKVVG